MKRAWPSVRMLVFGLLWFMGTKVALAESFVYLTNNTDQRLSLNVQQSGYDNIRHGDQWAQLAYEVEPLATVKFLRFNRDQGIKWGKEYFFDTYVSGADQALVLRQKLKGTMTFSKMWLSAADAPWFYDRDIHQLSLSQSQTLAFKSSYARASGDDIHYVVHTQDVAGEVSEYSNQLHVLTYNTWALLPPIESKNTKNRLDTIADTMTQYDVAVFQEVFDPILNARFRDRLDRNYPYQTGTPWVFGKVLTGGSFIASRWPILEQEAVVYQACRADGCLAAKGINYAKIHKGSNVFHIFGTHTHAYTGAEDVETRFKQLAQLKAFIDSKQIPETEPVILAGDFNVDKVNFPSEHDAFLNLLDAIEPQATGWYPYSYAGPVNPYADDAYNEYLDYVLYSQAHLMPNVSENRLLVPRSIDSGHWGTWDLSDHFPVEARFEFALPSEYMPIH